MSQFFQTPAINCYGGLDYIYNISGGNHQSTSGTSAIFYLDGDQSYEFSVRAVNEESLRSAFVTKASTSPPIGK